MKRSFIIYVEAAAAIATIHLPPKIRSSPLLPEMEDQIVACHSPGNGNNSTENIKSENNMGKKQDAEADYLGGGLYGSLIGSLRDSCVLMAIGRMLMCAVERGGRLRSV